MSGDYSTSNHTVSIEGTTANFVQMQGEEYVFPGNAAAILAIADSANWTFDSDFTVEIFGLKMTAATTTRYGILGHYNATGNLRSWAIDYRSDLSPKRFSTQISNDGTAFTTIEGNYDAADNVAYDLCLERSGSAVRLYLDGAMIGSGTHAGSLFNSTTTMKIGLGLALSSNPLAGRIKAVRITKGVARYANDAGYTVPTLPLPTSAP